MQTSNRSMLTLTLNTLHTHIYIVLRIQNMYDCVLYKKRSQLMEGRATVIIYCSPPPCLLRPTRQRSRSNICFIMRPYLDKILDIGQVFKCHVCVKMVKNSLLLFISHNNQNYRWYQESSWIWKIHFCPMLATKFILCLESFCRRVLNDRPHWDGAFATTGGIFGDSDKSAPQTWFIGYGRARNRPFCINLDPR